mgnify:FL=1
MKKRFKFLLSIFLLGSVISLSSCNNNKVDLLDPNTRELIKLNDVNELLPETPYTDSLKLKEDYTNKVFTSDGIGLVKLASNTDGDTAKFYDASKTINDRFTLRFLGINTPESTATIEPWGKKASVYVANILNKANENGEIVLINDFDVFGQKETNGRYLGFVWYRLDKNSDFRLLNLEIVEQGYSKNLLFDESKRCNYRSYFEKADIYASRLKLRVHGFKNDDGYDYNNSVVNTTIKYLLDNYEKLGVTDESSGKKLNIDATVLGLSGDNLYLRDTIPNEDGEYGYIYLYAGYGKSLASVVNVGDYINFYCRATTFLNSVQLSDIEYSSYGRYKFINYTSIANQDITNADEKTIKEVKATKEKIATFTPYLESDFNSLDDCKSLSDVSNFSNRLVKAKLTIRNVTASSDDDQNEGSSTSNEYYYKKDENSNMTIYSYLNDISNYLYINMRVDGTTYPYPEYSMFEVGKTYIVKGYLKPYYDKYQVCLFNNKLEFNYIEEFKEEME